VAVSDALLNLFDFSFLDWLLGPVDGDGGPRRRLPRKGIVPDVRGLDVASARRSLQTEGFHDEVRRLEAHPAPVMGTVVDQYPSPGVRWNRAKPIRMDVSHPPAVRDAG
jgi:hypothetical protein